MARGKLGLDSLSPQETIVAECVAEGWSNAQIATRLNIGVGTLRNLLTRSIFDKMGVFNRTELALMMQGLIFAQTQRSQLDNGATCANKKT